MNDDRIFKALADLGDASLPARPAFARDGQTLTELESRLEMTRFGVMKHWRPQAAGLVVTRWSGREKLHFLNPVPIRLIHNRWIHRRGAPGVGARGAQVGIGGEGMSADTKTRVTTQVDRGLHQGRAAGYLGRHHVARNGR